MTVSNFEHKAATVQNIENAVGLYLIPIVEAVGPNSTEVPQREHWEVNYVRDHANDWVLKGLQFEGVDIKTEDELAKYGYVVPNEIYTISSKGQSIPSPKRFTDEFEDAYIEIEGKEADDDNELAMSNATTEEELFHKYYFPLWQSYPATPDLVNYDMITTTTFRHGFTAMFSSEKAVIGTSFNLKSEADNFIIQVFQAYWQETANVFGDDPVSQLFIPIWDKPPSITRPGVPDPPPGEDRKIVAVLMAAIFWESYFEDSLSAEAPFLVELSNDCSQLYSYLVSGEDVTYLGQGSGIDDPNFDVRKEDKDRFANFMKHEKITLAGMTRRTSAKTTNIQWNDEYCPYSIRVYPTTEFFNSHHSNYPIILMLVAAFIVAFTAILFATYDFVVERRQIRVATKLMMADEIVRSLFPERVRERLYENQASHGENGSSAGENDSSHASLPNDNSPNAPLPEQSRAGKGKSGDTPITKNRKKPHGDLHDSDEMLIDNKGKRDKKGSSAITPVDKDIAGAAKWGKPIADIYQESTVFFCEVVGFTAWSSQREPTEIFTLLQTLFQCFDALAKKLGVFKVETVGEEYLAVTGLPEPQPDHAVRMARFAREIMYRMQDLTRGLEVELGMSTEEGALCSTRMIESNRCQLILLQGRTLVT